MTVLHFARHSQVSFNPVDYCFSWTADNWYTWDRKEAIRQAKAARSAYVKEQRSKGRDVTVFTLANQVIRRGGIGSGRPDIDFVESVYYCEVK